MAAETTDILSLPFIMPSQAQKHVTHNEALKTLDAVVQLFRLRHRRLPAPVGRGGRTMDRRAGARRRFRRPSGRDRGLARRRVGLRPAPARLDGI
jgi:hypothetical protein